LADINKRRTSLFEEYMNKHKKDNIDGTCVALICNREGSNDAWEKQYTLSSLTLRFTDRVGCGEGLNPDAIIGVTSVIWGFYQGAKEAIKSVQFE
jgi:hypothetical protein